MNTFITSCPHCKTQLKMPTTGVGATISYFACLMLYTIMCSEKNHTGVKNKAAKQYIKI